MRLLVSGFHFVAINANNKPVRCSECQKHGLTPAAHLAAGGLNTVPKNISHEICRLWPMKLLVGRRCLPGLFFGQDQHKPGALSFYAVGGDQAIVPFDNFLCNG